MEVFFESRDPESAKLRELSLLRARFILRRLAWLVPIVKVRLSDAHARRGCFCAPADASTRQGAPGARRSTFADERLPSLLDPGASDE